MKKITLLFCLILLFSLLSITFVKAEIKTDKIETTPSCGSEGCTLSNPLGSTDTPQKLIGKVINGVLGVVGSLALLMFIYGGFTWMTAAGSSDKVSHGKDIIIWATIGLVVIFSAYAMVRFVFNDILGGTAMISIERNV